MAELDEIRTFVEVVESGGFGRAAKRLGVSKSIVSRRIARLEADLGTRLVSRTTRGISPTEAGLELKERGARILADLAEARELVANRGGAEVAADDMQLRLLSRDTRHGLLDQEAGHRGFAGGAAVEDEDGGHGGVCSR